MIDFIVVFQHLACNQRHFAMKGIYVLLDRTTHLIHVKEINFKLTLLLADPFVESLNDHLIRETVEAYKSKYYILNMFRS